MSIARQGTGQRVVGIGFILVLGGGCATSARLPLSAGEHEAAARSGESGVAAEHRAAARRIRDHAEQACSGVDEQARQEPFPDRRAVASVGWLMHPHRRGSKRLHGARLTLAAHAPRAGELQRMLDCHLARSAALGWDRPEASSCPLCVRGASAKAFEGGSRIEVDTGGGPAAEEVWRRARLLARPAE